MADFRLFSIKNGVTELAPEQAAFERELQALLEKNMAAFEDRIQDHNRTDGQHRN